MGIVSPKTRQKIERFDARLSGEQKEFLQRAADVKGVSLTDFVLISAYDEAIKTIEDHEIVRLSAEASRVFRLALENPPAPSASTIKLFKKARRRLAQ